MTVDPPIDSRASQSGEAVNPSWPASCDGRDAGQPRRRLVVLGYCGLKPTEITQLLTEGRTIEIAAASGHFVVVAETALRQVTIVASRSGIVNYFFASGEFGPAHGPDAATVAREAGLRWSWDYEAIADYLSIGHLLGDRTPHAGVRRVPPGGVIEISGNRIKIEVPVWPAEQTYALPGTAFEAAIDALLVAARDLPPSACRLSMSGGFDSRLLLAALLAAGRRPHLLVSGVPGSFDREVSTAVAASLRLPLDIVEIGTADVVEGAAVAALASNGQLPVSHWAGLAHHRGPHCDPPAPVLIGSNGEFARNYYAPQTGLGDLPLVLASQSRALSFLSRRFVTPLTEVESCHIHSDLRRELTPCAIRDRLRYALGPAQGGGALMAMDHFFLTQHGRQKTSADLASLTALGVEWRVPFFDNPWVDAVRVLPRWCKFGSWFHRRAIRRLWPDLLRFPEQGGGAVTSSSPPASYWFGLDHGAQDPFFLDQAMFRSPALLDLLHARRELLSDLLDHRLVDRLLIEQAQSSTRPHLCFALMALALWREGVKEARHDQGLASHVSSPRWRSTSASP